MAARSDWIPRAVKDAVGGKAKFRALFLDPNDDARLQFFRYLFVGGLSFLADTAVLLLTSTVIRQSWIYVTVGFLVGVTVNYRLSKRMVFQKKRRRPGIEFLSVLIISVIGLLLTNWLFDLFFALFARMFPEYWTKLFAKIVSAGLVLIWNFCARKGFYAVCDRLETPKSDS